MTAFPFVFNRMGLGAVALLLKGHLKEEMPRYLYQRLRSSQPSPSMAN